MRYQPVEEFGLPPDAPLEKQGGIESDRTHPSIVFHVAKRAFDIVMCVALLPVMLLSALTLLALNPKKNKGDLFFVQNRMGRDCKPFCVIKFRSMTASSEIVRGVDDPLETCRITPLGDFLRRSRLDEVPQILNVLKGDMSLIGPRPDYIVHAEEFLVSIPGYKERHSVRPGISGFAQTEVGYAESSDATRQKVAADLQYIANRSIKLEAWIVWRTV